MLARNCHSCWPNPLGSKTVETIAPAIIATKVTPTLASSARRVRASATACDRMAFGQAEYPRRQRGPGVPLDHRPAQVRGQAEAGPVAQRVAQRALYRTPPRPASRRRNIARSPFPLCRDEPSLRVSRIAPGAGAGHPRRGPPRCKARRRAITIRRRMTTIRPGMIAGLVASAPDGDASPAPGACARYPSRCRRPSPCA